MKFGKNLRGDAVPQWRSCYLDYQHMKLFVIIIKRIVELINMAEKAIEQSPNHAGDGEDQLLNSEQIVIFDSAYLVNINRELKSLLEQANQLFFQAHIEGMEININFVHMKLLEISNNFSKCKILKSMPIEEKQKQMIINLIEFIYVECSYLEAMKDLNLEGQRKILKKQKKYAKGKVKTPFVKNRRYNRLGKCITKLLIEIEDMYAKYGQKTSKENRDSLRKLSQKIESTGQDSFIFGGWVGTMLTVIIILIIILAVNKLSIETDPIFNRDFPTWRGIAFFIFYIWIIGFNTLQFEKFGVSHRIIMDFNEHHYSTSTDVFKVAGFFSTFWLVMFAIYVVDLANIMNLQRIGSQYLVLFVWGLFLLFLFNPIPIFYWKSRLYAFKLALISIISPFRGVTFPVIWMTDQVISLVTPLKDFGYTLCYYQNIDFSEETLESSNYCNSATRIQIVFAVGAVAYSYRIVQCIRQGYDKGTYFFKPQFFNTIKYTSSLITLLLSYIYKAGDPNIFGIWLFFTIFTTLYSYVWDLKVDWALLEPGAPKRFLRRNLTFLPARNYYAIMIGNLILRLAWVTTLSPAIVDNTFGSPQIFSLVTGALQIFRRGLWNLLRVEREHLQNCKNFQALPDISGQLQLNIIDTLRKKTKDSNQSFEYLFTSSIIFLSNHILIEKIINKNSVEKKNFLKLIRQMLRKEQSRKNFRKQKLKQIRKRGDQLYSELKKIYRKIGLNVPKVDEYQQGE